MEVGIVALCRGLSLEYAHESTSDRDRSLFVGRQDYRQCARNRAAPYVRIGHGRITITFRSLGASRWPENQQVELALRAAARARAVLAQGTQRALRRRTARAIVVVYEDSSLVRGCAVVGRWECVVPVP